MEGVEQNLNPGPGGAVALSSNKEEQKSQGTPLKSVCVWDFFCFDVAGENLIL